MSLSAEHRGTLLQIAYDSVVHGVDCGGPLPLDPEEFDAPLREVRATFVTLKKGGRLRGCIGVTSPVRPLVVDVSHNAHSSSTRDPRFSPVRSEELDDLTISISILTVPERLEVDTRDGLLDALDVGTDGLIIRHGERRAAFLPVMWEQLPDPKEFLACLEDKGRRCVGRWHGGMEAWVFQAEYLSE